MNKKNVNKRSAPHDVVDERILILFGDAYGTVGVRFAVRGVISEDGEGGFVTDASSLQ